MTRIPEKIITELGGVYKAEFEGQIIEVTLSHKYANGYCLNPPYEKYMCFPDGRPYGDGPRIVARVEFRDLAHPTDKCDMEVGPCSCGAWHEKEKIPVWTPGEKCEVSAYAKDGVWYAGKYVGPSSDGRHVVELPTNGPSKKIGFNAWTHIRRPINRTWTANYGFRGSAGRNPSITIECDGIVDGDDLRKMKEIAVDAIRKADNS